MKKKVEIVLNLSERELAQLKELASRKGTSIDGYLEDALRMYLDGQLKLEEFDEFFKNEWTWEQ